MRATTRTRSGGGRAFLIGIVLVGVLLTIGALTADRRTGRPYDPASAEPDGTKAMVDLVSGFGAKVAVPDRLPKGDDADVAVIFEDSSDQASRDALRDWVRAGHILVVADPSSELVPEADIDPNSTFGSGSQASSTIPRGDCPVKALDNVDEIDPGPRAWYRFINKGTVPMCFVTLPGGGFLTADAEGDGVIIGLASAAVFTNEQLGEVDNAVLVTDLLAPRPGYRVSLLTDKAFPDSASVVSGSDGLTALISPGVKLLFLELLVALLVLAFASGRRLGRPIAEPQPVQIAGSELVEAVGQLLRQRRDPSAAAAVLRSDLRAVVVRRFGIAPDVEPRVMAEAIASRTSLEAEYVMAVIADQPVSTDTELATLATHIDLIREEVLHGHTA